MTGRTKEKKGTEGAAMNETPGRWFVGVDWATEAHQVCVLDAQGGVVGERSVAHSGTGLAELCRWLLEIGAG